MTIDGYPQPPYESVPESEPAYIDEAVTALNGYIAYDGRLVESNETTQAIRRALLNRYDPSNTANGDLWPLTDFDRPTDELAGLMKQRTKYIDEAYQLPSLRAMTTGNVSEEPALIEVNDEIEDYGPLIDMEIKHLELQVQGRRNIDYSDNIVTLWVSLLKDTSQQLPRRIVLRFIDKTIVLPDGKTDNVVAMSVVEFNSDKGVNEESDIDPTLRSSVQFAIKKFVDSTAIKPETEPTIMSSGPGWRRILSKIFSGAQDK